MLKFSRAARSRWNSSRSEFTVRAQRRTRSSQHHDFHGARIRNRFRLRQRGTSFAICVSFCALRAQNETHKEIEYRSAEGKECRLHNSCQRGILNIARGSNEARVTYGCAGGSFAGGLRGLGGGEWLRRDRDRVLAGGGRGGAAVRRWPPYRGGAAGPLPGQPE